MLQVTLFDICMHTVLIFIARTVSSQSVITPSCGKLNS